MDFFSELPGGVEWIIVYVYCFIAIVASLIAIIDVLKSKFKKPYDKGIFIFLILIFNLLGTILYFTLSRGRKIPKH